MLRIRAEIRLVQNRIEDAQAGLTISSSFCAHVVSQAQETLRSDRGCGTVHRFKIVEGIGCSRSPITETMQLRRRGVPIGNPISRTGVIDIEVTSGTRRS